MTVRKTIALVLVAIALFAAVVIYVEGRERDLLLHNIFASVGITAVFDNLFSDMHISLPDRINHSLPDGLWMFALATIILVIWDLKLSKSSLGWITIGLLIGLALEFTQLINGRFGTFDWMDVLFTCVGAVISILLFSKQHKIFVEREITRRSNERSRWVKT